MAAYPPQQPTFGVGGPGAVSMAEGGPAVPNGHHGYQQHPQEEEGVTLARIQEAHGTIGPLIHLTPVLRCEALDQAMACRESARGPRRLFFKVCVCVCLRIGSWYVSRPAPCT